MNDRKKPEKKIDTFPRSLKSTNTTGKKTKLPDKVWVTIAHNGLHENACIQVTGETDDEYLGNLVHVTDTHEVKVEKCYCMT